MRSLPDPSCSSHAPGMKVDHRTRSSWPHEACGFRGIYWLWQYLAPSVALPSITYDALRVAFSTAVAETIMCKGPLVLAAGDQPDVEAPTNEDGPDEATASALEPADQVMRWQQVLANRVQRLHSAENPVLPCPAHEHIGKRHIPTTMRIEMLTLSHAQPTNLLPACNAVSSGCRRQIGRPPCSRSKPVIARLGDKYGAGPHNGGRQAT